MGEQGRESQLGCSMFILSLASATTRGPWFPHKSLSLPDLSDPGRKAHTIQPVSLDEREKTACLEAGGWPR